MKKSLSIVSIILLVGLGTTFVYAQYDVPTNYSTIQAAINAAPASSTINVAAGTYTENITVSKSLTIIGAGAASTTITPSVSGVGITVAANAVTLKNFTVSGTTGSINNHGIWVNGFSGLTIQNVNATNNAGSGIALRNVSASIINVIAQDNKSHGLEIGNGSTGVQVSGGIFDNNGTAGVLTTGGGIMIYADAGQSTNSTSISGSVDVSSNTTAGIYLSCNATGHINSTNIGDGSNIIEGDNNGSSRTSGYGTGGAAVLLFGPCDHTTINKGFSNHSDTIRTAGLVILGTDASGSYSPTNTVVKNCNLTGFSSTSPAATMKVPDGSYICINDVDATDNNMIDAFTSGFDVEDVLVHKVDNSQLGLFKGPISNTVLFVTQNSGSIQRAIDIANAYPAITEIDVKDGTYAENVTVNKALIINGQGANTIIKPSTAVNVTIEGVTLENLHIYLNGPILWGVVAPTCSNNTFTFTVNAKVFLQGPYSSGSMSTNLRRHWQVFL